MDEQSRYHTLLRAPVRRKMIELLGEQEKIGFKELRQALGLGVGTVYYHLDMLSDFITQDKRRKYALNDRGRLLFKSLKEGSAPQTLQIREAFSHRISRWLFLSPLFAKTAQPLVILPFSVLVLFFGAVGSALVYVEPLLLFYLPFASFRFETLALLYLFNWIGLFLFSDVVIYLFYRRSGGELQLFTCLGIASFPMALFPYLLVFLSYDVARYLLLAFQVWSLLLLSAAYSFGKGLRLDKSIVVSLMVLFINIGVLLATGRLL
jgi:hypothetical protein